MPALAPDTLAAWRGLLPEPLRQLIHEAGRWETLVVPDEEKQTDPDENIMAEYGVLDAFLLLVTATCFPFSFGLNVRCSGCGPISKMLVCVIFSPFTGFYLVLRPCSSLWHSC